MQFGKFQFLEFLRIDQRALLQKVVQQIIHLTCGALRPIELDDLPALQLAFTQMSTPDQSQYFPFPIPQRVLAGIPVGMQTSGFPTFLQLVEF